MGAMLGSTVDTCSASVLCAFGRFAHIFHGDVDSNPAVFVSVLTRNGEVCLADASALSPGMRARTWKTGHYFYELHVAETRDDGGSVRRHWPM